MCTLRGVTQHELSMKSSIAALSGRARTGQCGGPAGFENARVVKAAFFCFAEKRETNRAKALPKFKDNVNG